MNREGAETYLRLLAGAKMRGALAHVADRPRRSPPGGGRMGIMLVAEALTAVGALGTETVDDILADFDLALGVRQLHDQPGAGPGMARSMPYRIAPPGTMHAAAVAVEPAGKNSGIVQHQTIAGLEKLREVAKHAVLPAPGPAIEHQHARPGAVPERLLRNQFFRQFVVEIRQPHSRTTVAEKAPAAARLPTIPDGNRPARTPGRSAHESFRGARGAFQYRRRAGTGFFCSVPHSAGPSAETSP